MGEGGGGRRERGGGKNGGPPLSAGEHALDPSGLARGLHVPGAHATRKMARRPPEGKKAALSKSQEMK